jgi:glycosyltransferase involved in cell wall biosynthesis
MTGGKRVLMVAPTPYFSDRGCHVQIYEVARSQQLNGNDVEIVTYHLGRDMPGIATHRTLRMPWYRRREAGPSLHKLYIDLLLMRKTLERALRYRPTVIHAHMHEGAAIALPVARALGLPLVMDLQGSLAGELVNHRFVRAGSVGHRLTLAVERRVNRSVDAVLMWTYISEALRAQFSYPPEVVFTLDYGVDTETFRPHPPETLGDLRGALGLPPGHQVVVYLGTLSAYQGIDCLLSAIPEIMRRRPRTHFLIMGYPDEAHYRAEARRLGIADHVTLPGRVNYTQAARYLSLGDIAVAPKLTTAEGNGKLLNYMACGLPTVAFDLPGNLATLGDVGCYVPRGDAAALAGAIVALMEDDERRADLARGSRARAEERYAWRAIGRTIDAMYDEVIARAAGRGGARLPAEMRVPGPSAREP